MKCKLIISTSLLIIITIISITLISFNSNTNTQEKYSFKVPIALQKPNEDINHLYFSKKEHLEGMTLFKPNNSNFCMQIPQNSLIYAGKHIDDNTEAYTYNINFDNNLISIVDTYKYSNNIFKPNSIEELIEFQKNDGITLSGNIVDFEVITEDEKYMGYSFCQYIKDNYKIYHKIYIDDNRIIGICMENGNALNINQCLDSFVIL